MNMSEYKAIAIGKNQRILVPKSEVVTKLADLYHKDPSQDYYVSVFDYNQSHFDQFKKTKSLAGMENVFTNTILFDFDSKTDLDKARADVLTLVGRLVQKGINKNDLNVSFSGNKGYHLELYTDKKLNNIEADNIRTELTKDLETNDNKIKDNQRIIRAPLSMHQETKLYKIPVTVDELSSMNSEQIKKLAVEPDDLRYQMAGDFAIKIIQLPDDIYALRKSKKKEAKVIESMDEKPDFNKNKTGLTNSKYALSEGYFDAGERNEAVMILAATYRALGYNEEISYNSIKATLRLRARRLSLEDLNETGRKEVWSAIQTVYSPTWKGGMYGEDNDLIKITKARYNIQDKFEQNLVVTLPEVNSIFSDFAMNIDKNTLKLGIPSFDHEIRVTSSTLVGLLAAPSAGKSSISFGILNSTSLDGIKSMFFSLDMAAPQVYQRLAQRHTGFDADRLFHAYQKNDIAVIEKVERTLEEQYRNVKFCFRGGVSPEQIREAILKEKELTGEFPKLVVIDYLECITTQFSDPTVSKGYAARMMKDIANEFAICVLLLVQPPKVAGDPSYELNSYTDIKGSSVVSEACSQVFTIHRPGFNPKNIENDNFLTLTVVKNRMGKLGSYDYHWTGVTGAIRELSHEDQSELKCLRDQKNKERKDDL